MIDRLAHLTPLRFAAVFAGAMGLVILLAFSSAALAAAISTAAINEVSRDDTSVGNDTETTDGGGDDGTSAQPTDAASEASPSNVTTSTLAPLPRSCDDVYSAQMRATLASHAVQLNPTRTANGVTGVAFSDPVIDDTIRSIPTLRCFWGDPGTQTGFVMETRIAAVTEEQAHGVQSRLASIGYTPIQELGGTRYYFDDGVDYYGRPFGESHIVVGGYWFATAWSEVGISGYTADMVRSVLG